MSKLTLDFAGKYFDKLYPIPQLTDQKKIDIFYSLLTTEVEKFSSDIHEILISEIQEANSIFQSIVSHHFKDFRKIKLFEKIFSKNVRRLQRDVYFPDIVIASILQSTHIDLLEFIKKNKEYLLLSLDGNFDYRLGNQERKENLEDIFRKNQITSEDSEVINFLFPHTQEVLAFDPSKSKNEMFEKIPGLENFINNAEIKQRISHPLVFERFFHILSPDDYISKVLSQNEKNDILTALKVEEVDYIEITKKLWILFPLHPFDSLSRQFSINWIQRIIKSENHVSAYNIIFASSILAKDLSNNALQLFELSEKSSLSSVIWIYLRREDSEKKILIEIQKFDESSDEFAVTALDYATREDDIQDNNKRILGEKIVNMCAMEFLHRIQRKIDRTNQLFSKEFSDSPVKLIWGWRNCIKFFDEKKLPYPIKVQLHDFLEHYLSSNIGAFRLFLVEFNIFDELFPYRNATLKREIVNQLLSEEKLATIYESFKSSDLNKITAKYSKPLNDWYKGYKKHNDHPPP